MYLTNNPFPLAAHVTPVPQEHQPFEYSNLEDDEVIVIPPDTIAVPDATATPLSERADRQTAAFLDMTPEERRVLAVREECVRDAERIGNAEAIHHFTVFEEERRKAKQRMEERRRRREADFAKRTAFFLRGMRAAHDKKTKN